MRSCQFLWFPERHFIKLMFVSRKHKLRRLNNTSHPFVPSSRLVLVFWSLTNCGWSCARRKLSLKLEQSRPSLAQICKWQLGLSFTAATSQLYLLVWPAWHSQEISQPEDFLTPYWDVSSSSSKTKKTCTELRIHFLDFEPKRSRTEH